MTTRREGFSSTALKIMAVATMLIDHIGAIFENKLYAALPFLNADGFEILRVIGRIAFPLFAFMIAEGAGKTKSIYKYLGRLLAFAFVSEVPFQLAVNHPATFRDLVFSDHRNVFFTLFLGLLCIFIYEKLREYKLEFLAFAALFIAAWAAESLIKSDYGAAGVLAIFLFYIFLHAPKAVRYAGIALTVLFLSLMFAFDPYVQQAVTVSGRRVHLYHMDVSARVNFTELYALFSLPLLYLYNGKKGKKINRWVFYAFYPAHLLIYWLIWLAV